MVCVQDDTEPNDAQDGSQALTDATCGAALLSFVGTLDGSMDIDWFGVFANWINNCSQEAQVTVDVGGGLEVCAYHDCIAGGADFECVGTATPTMAPNGDPGCCDTGDVTFRYACQGGDHDAILSLSVTGASANECLDYNGDYQVTTGNFF
jgi:hypothetical protein